uniref:Putative tail protein n=1 Tax=viral metagenome TaxID=1070528 RepID=A0A6M3K8Q0_9ZZZZ
MAKVTLRNVFEEVSEFEGVDRSTVLSSAIEYARTKNHEIYKIIMQEKVKIFLNGELLLPNDWTEEVTENDEIIIVPSLEGGILEIILGVALMVASIWVPPLAVFSTTLKAIVFFTGLALSMGGLSNLLFAPNLPSMPSIRGGGNQTQTYNWSGIKSAARQDIPVPVLYGTHDVGGNVISLFTEAYGEDNYLYVLLALCEGEIDGICKEVDSTSVCQTSDTSDSNYADPAIKLDDQYISKYTDIEWWYRTGTNLPGTSGIHYPFEQNKIPYFDGARIQYDDGREVTSSGIEYTTTKEIDMLALQVRAPALYKLNNSGGIDPYTVNYKVEWKPTGGSYSTYSATKWQPGVTSGASGTNSYHCTCNSYRGYTYRYGVKPKTYKIKVLDNTFSPFIYQSGTDTQRHNDIIANYDIIVDILDENNNIIEKSKKISQSVTQSWTRPIFNWTDYNTGIGETTYTVTVSHSYTSIFIGDYRVTLSQNVLVGNIFTISSTNLGSFTEIPLTATSKTGVWSSLVLDMNTLSDGDGVYTIRVSRTGGEKSTSLKVEDNLILESITEIVQGKFIYPNTALLGLKIKATGQLSGSPPNMITTVRGKKVEVPDLEDTSPSGTDVTFDSAFWDAAQSRWENSSGNEVFWNNESSWRREYSENSMCCVRDLALSNRYGLGAYWNKSDLSNSGMISVIKTCHTTYNPYGSDDYFAWWDMVNDDDWSKRWEFYGRSDTVTGSYDKTARTITFNGSVSSLEFYNLRIYTNTGLIKSQTYSFTATIANLTKSCSIIVYGRSIQADGTIYDEKYGTISAISNGVKTLPITPSKSGVDSLILQFTSNTGLDLRVDDISMTRTTNEHYHTYNGILESEQSAMTALVEMCESFRVWPIWYNGVINFVVNSDSTPVHTLSLGNTFNFSQTFTPLSDIPYTLLGQFTDENDNFTMKQVAAKASTSKVINKTNKQTVGLKGITSIHKAGRELTFKLNNAINANHSIHIECGPDMLHAIAGDIIFIQDDLPQWGQGGRILSYTATNIVLDRKYTFANAATSVHIVKYQTDANVFVNATVDKTYVVTNASLQTVPIVTMSASPCEDSVYAIGVNVVDFKKFRLVNVSRVAEDRVEVDVINHVASVYDSVTVKLIENNKSNLDSLTLKPGVPRNVVVAPSPLAMGLGFVFKADPPIGNVGVKEIVVQMDDSGNNYYETIAIIPTDQRQAYYINNNLTLEKTYRFRFFCRTTYKNSDPIEVSFTLKKATYVPLPPSGISLKGSTNVGEFDGRDITLIWNRVGQTVYSDSLICGYKVEVYHTTPFNPSNLLRAEETSTEEYVYSLEKNRDDCTIGGLSVAYNTTLYFVLYTNAVGGTISRSTTPFVVTTATPAQPTGLAASPAIGGMTFLWDQNTTLSFDRFQYRYRISTVGTYSSWYTTKSNSIGVEVTDSDVTTYGKNATMYFQVKSFSYFGLESGVASIADVYNTLADNIFQLIGNTDGTGNASSLYNGNITSGGVSF